MRSLRSASLAAAFLLSGCYKNTIQTGAQPGASSDHKAKFYVYGLAGEANFNLDQICPSGVAKIEESAEFVDSLVGCLTCSIYTPITVKITCASGSAWNLTPDELSGRTLVSTADAEDETTTDEGA
jgi:hypothetical protein